MPELKTVNVAGAAIVKVAVGTGALEELGYTGNGAEIRTEAYFQNVPGDENGGDDGPPIEIVYLGETARVRLELTKWNPLVADKISARMANATVGTVGVNDPGTLMFTPLTGTKNTTRVCIASARNPMNFPRCLCREPIEINKGTKFSRLVLEFEAHKDENGYLFNTTVA